jgi:hypothetical protein
MIFVRSVVVWFLFILAESLNGTVRNLWLIPAVGDERLAHVISFITGSILIVAIATIFIQWLKAQRFSQLLGVGVLWVLLTLGFELCLGRLVLGYSWERIAADYNLIEGGLMPIGLILVMLAPWIATKLQYQRSTHTQHTV